MARGDQTQTAVLGALSVMPMTGYALRSEIQNTLGHFWNESFGQIYPTLAELERQGLVERRGAERTGSSTFAITGDGTARLRELLAQPEQPARPRNGLLLRLFFGRQLGPEACRDLVEAARRRAVEQLAHMSAVREELRNDQQNTADSPYWLLTVSAGEHAARATIAWADETLAALANLPAEENP
ncbi:transcriptional regulator, PadR family [Cryptosporangium aurantiacum]|uniref:Transcriptional regulator, PadR family n=2 Tax=Cryptosporangium aurantiacum TaxID=134849 RepID=A0A1M7RF65_9ACTN|nr:transcriptional regulator, PadR family [Cryptosporangium aurantiacum]